MKTKILYGIILASLLAISAIGGYRYGVRKSIEGGALALLINDDAFKAETQKRIVESYEALELEKLGRSVVCRTDTLYLPAPCGAYSNGVETMRYTDKQRRFILKERERAKKFDSLSKAKYPKGNGGAFMECVLALQKAKTKADTAKICLKDGKECAIMLGGVGGCKDYDYQ